MKAFDADYYRRHYLTRRTAVTSPAEMAIRGDFIGAFVHYGGLSVRTILDAGCGLGWLRKPLLKQFPGARYTGLEASEYLCERHGWTQGSLATFAPGTKYDLVVCYDVLQYLNDRDATRAMANLARLTYKVLYFSALTQEDWDLRCDQRLTDREVHIRPAAWYRERLDAGKIPRYTHLGGGLYLRRGMEVQLWELERHR